MYLNQGLLILHFIGLAMGLSTGLSNIVMQRLIAKAAPSDVPVLMRFPPMMARVGSMGLGLLWITGLAMLFNKWGGFANIGNMPWQFHVKLTLVIILSGLVGYFQVLERKLRGGDRSVISIMQKLGPVAFLTAIAIIVFAVLAFT
jgi:uncharacterized membrane protein